MRDSDSALFADAAIVWHPETSILKLLSETHRTFVFRTSPDSGNSDPCPAFAILRAGR